jgi:hypothetical protein
MSSIIRVVSATKAVLRVWCTSESQSAESAKSCSTPITGAENENYGW